MNSASCSENQSQDYYDSIASRYDVQIDTATNRKARECFWRCAEAILPSTARILDFGAGSGIDAQYFAARGHFVVAYDTSNRMLDLLRHRCAGEISAGQIVAVDDPIQQAAAKLASIGPFDAIFSNFAVFSTIPELNSIFSLFAALVRPGGAMLIAIQNPWQPGHFRSVTFWKALVRSLPGRPLRYFSPELGTVYHHRVGQVLRAAERDFYPTRRAADPCRSDCFGWSSPFELIELTRR